jgi:4-amino-4-deoxy-L-arabinose transferase-like glycosyltransferase
MHESLTKVRAWAAPGFILAASSAALLLGFVLPDKGQMSEWFRAGAYYLVFAAFLLWLAAMCPREARPGAITAWAVRHAAGLVLAALLTLGMLLVSPPEFRILADETNMASIAAAMFREQAVYNSTEGLYYYDAYHDTRHVWGIRPLFYPFVVHLAHALTGYRVENAFIVNALAGFATLVVFYVLLARWFDRRSALLGMLLLASYPLFVVWVTSGGFETLNLLFLLLAFAWLDRFLAARDPRDLERLGLTLVLLAQLRYESALYVATLGVTALACVRRADLPRLSPRLAAIPLLLLPVAWQRLSNFNHRSFQVEPERSLFSLEELLGSLDSLWLYFFTEPSRYLTIPLLSWLALLGFAIAGWQLWRTRPARTPRSLGLAVAALASGVSTLALFLAYQHEIEGMTHPATIRYGIIYLPGIVFGVVFLLHRLLRDRPSLAGYAAIAALALLAVSWPLATNNDALGTLTLPREYRTTTRFLDTHFPSRNVIVVAERPGLYTPQLRGAASFGRANGDPAALLGMLRQHLVQEILVLQKIHYRDRLPTPATRLDGAFRLETLFESQVTATWFSRISRVVPEPGAE